jgi:hypothetical protein
MAATLFTSVKAGALALPSRILMAPLTRCRSPAPSYAPPAAVAAHYAARAAAGLIITEATLVSEYGRGFHGECCGVGASAAGRSAAAVRENSRPHWAARRPRARAAGTPWDHPRPTHGVCTCMGVRTLRAPCRGALEAAIARRLCTSDV